jgi:hypothetical protein
MPNNTKSGPIDRAAPAIHKSKKTDAEKIEVTRSTSKAMQQSPDWANAADVQTAVKSWNQTSDDLEANAKAIADLRHQLLLAVTKQRTIRRTWRARTLQVLSNVNVFSDGSADTIKGFSLDVRGTPGSHAALVELTVTTGKTVGTVLAAWPKNGARHGFMVQHATDPSNSATYASAQPSTRAKYTLGGAPSGSTVYFRVAPIDPKSASGQGPWSAWAAGTVK